MPSQLETPPVSHARLVVLPHHAGLDGEVVVMQGSAHVPFAIARVFTVHASKGAIRGRHAHKRCAQFMVCSAGRVQVVCDDGTDTASFVLDQKNLGLFVPPGIWAHQWYQQDDSVLMVLCDRAYEAEDYVRDYTAFLAYRCP